MQYGGTVYILTNVHHEVLYIGVTSDLFTRITEHIMKVYPNFIYRKI
ncbi:MAG TPA: GIY-YIG nuclease family protein [Parafilimonas sp.]|nr:GIY-YIG nuclease family protein [Parafilimonas sp.]